MTVDISPDAQAQLDAEAARRSTDTEEAAFADMQALSLTTLREYWINEEDAVYDAL